VWADDVHCPSSGWILKVGLVIACRYFFYLFHNPLDGCGCDGQFNFDFDVFQSNGSPLESHVHLITSFSMVVLESLLTSDMYVTSRNSLQALIHSIISDLVKVVGTWFITGLSYV
jgi:hypothetical protein